MKATPLAVLAVTILAALCAALPIPASAQAVNRGDIYAVAGVNVDETAANGAAAQRAGFAAAARIGFERLAQRLTLPAEQARGLPTPDERMLENLAISVDVEQERRSATRYIARLTVRFNAELVRDVLRNAGYTVVEQRGAPILIVASADPATPPETQALWRQVWTDGGYTQELAPLALAQPIAYGPPDWAAVANNARSEGSVTAIYAVLSVRGSTATANLVEVTAAGSRNRGAVTAAVPGSDANAQRQALQSLAQQVNTQIQNEWKARVGGPATPTQTTNVSRARVAATALYTSQAQWEQIKSALEAAAATLISGIRIEAVGRDGALVSFVFTGSREQLAAELARRGVALEDTAAGPVLRVAARR